MALVLEGKIGSMPLDTPAIRLRVPVGAMVFTVALRIGAPPPAAAGCRASWGKRRARAPAATEAATDSWRMKDIISSAEASAAGDP